jgi:hypothetical protein
MALPENQTMSPEDVPEAVLDSFEGMLLWSAFGDALGASRELEALGGAVATDPAALDLLTAEEVVAARARQGDLVDGQKGETWGVWPDAVGIKEVATARGLPTDDTGVRTVLVGEWLWEALAAGGDLSETAFAAWLEPFAKDGLPEAASLPWLERRRGEQAVAWRAMVHAAHHPLEPIQPENPFFRPGLPVIFGPFLYLPLAAAFYQRPPVEVFLHFMDFSVLDQEHGRVVTGLLAALVAQAVTERPFQAGIGEWFFSAAGPVLADARGHVKAEGLGVATEAQHRAWLDEVEDALVEARELGLEARLGQMASGPFLERVAERIYRPAITAGPGVRHGLAPYEPLLVLRQLAATAAYAGDDPARLLRLLAAGPGDADTLAFLMGTLVGAWYGRRALEALPGVDLEPVVAMLWRLFEVDLPLQAGMYGQLLAEAGGVAE